MAIPKLRRRWFQYSLQTLLALMLLAGIGLSWFSRKLDRGRRQMEAVAAMLKFEGHVGYDYQFDAFPHQIDGAETPGPNWLRERLGDDFFREVVYVSLEHTDATDADLKHLKQFRRLQWLDLRYTTQVTDHGLEHVQGCTELRGLWLSHVGITDAGLTHLTELPRLRELYLNDVQVTDGGVANITRLRELRVLHLAGTRVTDHGLAHLKGLQTLETLNLEGTRITDAGLAHVKELRELRALLIAGTKVTDAGLAQLKDLHQLQSLSLGTLAPGTYITDAGVAHLRALTQLRWLSIRVPEMTSAGSEHLARLTHLERLYLWGSVSNDGAERLQMALPNCKVYRSFPLVGDED